jgi:hypothetical protein
LQRISSTFFVGQAPDWLTKTQNPAPPKSM